MILAFDLDDTLFDELSYVRSGFRAVAQWAGDRFGWNPVTSADTLWRTLQQSGRGQVFNHWLAAQAVEPTAARVRECVRVYRHHHPDITLWPEADALLTRLQAYPRYLVTDGHRVVQALKVEALGLRPRMRHVYITHRYGLAHAKPSLHCFELMRRRERCSWKELIYVGDNPVKDFVNLNRAGAKTVRVLTGQHRDRPAAPGYEAQHVIASLDELPALIERSAAR
jgi:putative hydrolase of the HAD superfamily